GARKGMFSRPSAPLQHAVRSLADRQSGGIEVLEQRDAELARRRELVAQRRDLERLVLLAVAHDRVARERPCVVAQVELALLDRVSFAAVDEQLERALHFLRALARRGR